MDPESPLSLADEEELDSKVEDKYEDAGELDMSAAQTDLLLTRMPKYTWEALAAMKEDDEIRVGTLRVQGDRQNPAKISMLLDQNVRGFKNIPREYNLQVMGKPSTNTFVFTEKDLPGFSRRTGAQGGSQGVSKPQAYDKSSAKGRSFRMPGYRRAIPKKTSLAGHARNQYQCAPVENKDYVQILTKRAAEKPEDKTAPEFMKPGAEMGHTINQANPMNMNNSFNGFIRTAPPRDKKQQQKFARMPKNELLDILFRAFQEYKYWYLKDLKARTQQPEQYLRETLEEIAELVRQGNTANTWRLKQGASFAGQMDPSTFEAAQEAVAPDVMEDDDDDDFDNVKMEDV